MEPSRWQLLDETTPSGKSLFRCTVCSRISPTPDKRCPNALCGVASFTVGTVERGKLRFVDHTGILDDYRDAERYRDALREIAAWATEAYPVEQFPDQDMQRAASALADVGVSIGALHGQWARHLTAGIGAIARKALEGGE